VHRIVRGVTISRHEVSIDEWVHTLALVLVGIGANNAAARQPLIRLLGA
jgi:hypothetical protein